jgi:hypothetical protein
VGVENDYLTDIPLSAERVWPDGDFSRTLTRYIRERLNHSSALFPSKLGDHTTTQTACDGLNKFAITVEVRSYRLNGSRSSLADVQFVPSDALIGDIMPTKHAVTGRAERVQLCRTAVECACLPSRIGVAVSLHVSSS